MKAAVMRASHAPLEFEDVSVDDPFPGEVLVKTAASGICHSDPHVIQGSLPLPSSLHPRTRAGGHRRGGGRRRRRLRSGRAGRAASASPHVE
jgi:S-(hydroxymethyl)glutathione dehydrogenase/alcohol dehydrogenase